MLALPNNAIAEDLSRLLLRCCTEHSEKTQLDSSVWRNSADVAKRHNIEDVIDILDQLERNPSFVRQLSDDVLQYIFGSLAYVNRQHLHNTRPDAARVYNGDSRERGIGKRTFYNAHTSPLTQIVGPGTSSTSTSRVGLDRPHLYTATS